MKKFLQNKDKQQNMGELKVWMKTSWKHYGDWETPLAKKISLDNVEVT